MNQLAGQDDSSIVEVNSCSVEAKIKGKFNTISKLPDSPVDLLDLLIAPCRCVNSGKCAHVLARKAMNIHTTRFGKIDIEPEDILFFRGGLIGFESCRHWVLLADGQNSAVGWLQSMQKPDIALPVVSPRRFVTDYQVRLEPKEIERLQLASAEQAYVLGVVGRDDDVLTMNLRAPVVINLDRRIGCQIVTVDDQPTQYELATLPISLRRSA